MPGPETSPNPPAGGETQSTELINKPAPVQSVADLKKLTKRRTSWRNIIAHANVIGSIAALFLFLFAIGGIAGYFYSQSAERPDTTKKTNITSLSADDISKLSEIGTNLGTSGQTLNIGANALLRGRVDVGGDLSVSGRFNANGPVNLSQLNITGTTAVSGLSVGSNMTVTGTTTLQQTLTVNGLATFNGGINSGGSSSFNSLNATTISVRNINISGPLTIGHINTQGPVPSFVTGTAVGAGGTGSISGNDTSGTLNFNVGTTPPAGVLGTVTFRATYTGTVHVLLSPITGAAGSTPVYVTRNAGGFQVRTDSAPPAGSTLSFDYFVTQ